MTEPAPSTDTVLHTHVEGVTGLRARLGDDKAEDVLRGHEGIVRDAIERYGGRDAESIGEGFVASFVTARAAVDAAVAIQRGFDAYAEEGLRIRVGAAERPETAAALVAAAHGRQILASEAVRAMAGTMPGVQFVSRGGFRLGGEAGAEVHEVMSSIRRERTASQIPRSETPFVGREAERDALRERLDEALAGHGSVVLISGATGVGKTRLAEDVAEEASRRGFLALTGRCEDLPSPPPFMPLQEILRVAASVVPSDVFRESLGDALVGVVRFLPELRAAFPGDAEAEAESPEAARLVLLDSLRGFLERTSRRRPTLLVLNDLQWADPHTVDLLHHTLERIRSMPAIILGTYRGGDLGGRPLGKHLGEIIASPAATVIELEGPPA
jgi:AAA ATPase-like protein